MKLKSEWIAELMKAVAHYLARAQSIAYSTQEPSSGPVSDRCHPVLLEEDLHYQSDYNDDMV